MTAEKLDRIDAMERQLRRVIELRPDYAHAYNALGYSLADRNVRLPEALQLIEKAHQLAPEDPYILDSLGWVYYRMGDLPQARKYLEQAYQASPMPRWRSTLRKSCGPAASQAAHASCCAKCGPANQATNC